MSNPLPPPYLLAHMDQMYARARDDFAAFVSMTAEILETYGGNKALVAAIMRTRIDMSWGTEIARSIAAVALVEWADIARCAVEHRKAS